MVLVWWMRKHYDIYLDDSNFAGDNKRFITIDYEKDKSKPPSKFEEFKADVLESGKIRYTVKMKNIKLPSGKKIKLATKEDKK